MKQGRVSITSPIARAMIGKESGDDRRGEHPRRRQGLRDHQGGVGLTHSAMAEALQPRLTIWAVSDGRVGIEAQVLGLAEAVARLRPADIVVKRMGWRWGLGRRRRPDPAGCAEVGQPDRAAVAGHLDRRRARQPAAVARDAPLVGRQDLRRPDPGSARPPRRLRPGGPAGARRAGRPQRLADRRRAQPHERRGLRPRPGPLRATRIDPLPQPARGDDRRRQVASRTTCRPTARARMAAEVAAAVARPSAARCWSASPAARPSRPGAC